MQLALHEQLGHGHALQRVGGRLFPQLHLIDGKQQRRLEYAHNGSRCRLHHGPIESVREDASVQVSHGDVVPAIHVHDRLNRKKITKNEGLAREMNRKKEGKDLASVAKRSLSDFIHDAVLEASKQRLQPALVLDADLQQRFPSVFHLPHFEDTCVVHLHTTNERVCDRATKKTSV